MATHFHTLLSSTPSWLTGEGDIGDIAIATLGRLVRNLPDYSFPGWSTAKTRHSVVDTLLPIVLARPGFKTAFHADMASLSLEQRRILLERRLITPCMAARQEGCHVIVPRKQDISVMLNEEEHLVAHFFRKGFELATVLRDMQHFAESLERDVRFASNSEQGYLTSLPSEAGEGMQFYAVLHLPALTLNDNTEQLARGLEKLQVNMSPFYNGMQDDTGNTYVLFTPAIPVNETEEVMEDFSNVVQAVIVRELQVRSRLLSTSAVDIADRMGRALGTLCYAMRLSYRESLDYLSLLRLGNQYGLLAWEQPANKVMNELTALSLSLAPAHGVLYDGCRVPQDFVPVLRAVRMKTILSNASPSFSLPFSSL